MIAIVDYGAGNIFSVKNALDFLGLESQLTDDAAAIQAATPVTLNMALSNRLSLIHI